MILLESNHDPDMLIHNTRYRITSKTHPGHQGHLSNLTCAETLAALFETGVNRALLGHLSADNNTPELALQTVTQELSQKGLKPGVDIHLT